MNFSPITDDLFIGTTPSTEDYDQLRGLGVKLVINMRWDTNVLEQTMDSSTWKSPFTLITD